MKISKRYLYAIICFFFIGTSVTFPADVSNNINLIVGLTELVDLQYRLNVNSVSFNLRPGIGTFLFYKAYNQKGWEIAPEFSVSYYLLKKRSFKIGPEIGILYVYHNEYYNFGGTLNYFEESKTDLLIENIRIKTIWSKHSSRFHIGGNIGFSIVEQINKAHIIENRISKYKSELVDIGIFPLVSFETGFQL